MGAKLKKLKKNQCYYVKFYDHCIGDEPEVVVDFVGFYVEESENYYIFSHWLIDTADHRLRHDNLERSSLMKCAIISIREVKVPNKIQ